MARHSNTIVFVATFDKVVLCTGSDSLKCDVIDPTSSTVA